MLECYECGGQVAELSARSRCVHCEYSRAMFNETENESLRYHKDPETREVRRSANGPPCERDTEYWVPEEDCWLCKEEYIEWLVRKELG